MGFIIIIYFGYDRSGSRSWEHLAFQLCAVFQWWGIIFHSLLHSNSHYGNSLLNSGIRCGILIQGILFEDCK